MSLLFVGSIIGFCTKDWLVHNFLTFKTEPIAIKNLNHDEELEHGKDDSVAIENVVIESDIPENIDTRSDITITSVLDSPNFEVITETNDFEHDGLTSKINYTRHKINSNIYLLDVTNSNNITAATIMYDTFGEILSAKFDEEQFPEMSYYAFGNYLLHLIAVLISKDKSFKAIIYIVTNELRADRNPLRESFIKKYENRYNNLYRTICRIKKMIGNSYKNNLNHIQEIIDEQYNVITLTSSYNVNNVLTQFMMENGNLKNIGPLLFVETEIRVLDSLETINTS